MKQESLISINLLRNIAFISEICDFLCVHFDSSHHCIPPPPKMNVYTFYLFMSLLPSLGNIIPMFFMEMLFIFLQKVKCTGLKCIIHCFDKYLYYITVISIRIKTKWLSNDPHSCTTSQLPQPKSQHISNHSSLCSHHLSNIYLLVLPPTNQAYSCLRAFPLAVPSTWKNLP